MELSVRSREKILVGFTGRAGVGKTVTAEWFEAQHEIKILSFAEPLKESLSALTGLSIDHFKDPILKEKVIPGLDTTPRILMQLMATDFIRDMVDPDFWLWRMRQALSKYSHRDIMIDDVRFPNEAEMIRINGGTIVHLRRSFVSTTDQTGHKSEIPLEVQKGDIVINSPDGIELTALEVSQSIW